MESQASAGSASKQPDYDERHDAAIHRYGIDEELFLEVGQRVHHIVRSSSPTPPLQLLSQVTESSDLIVVFHGALSRSKYSTPRFEFLSSLQDRPENLLFIADPTVEVGTDLDLAWYTGTETWDLPGELAVHIQSVASQIGAGRILLLGGSGGGFAAMSVSALLPGSMALAFNPQIRISKYWKNSVEPYRRALFPEHSIASMEATMRERVNLLLAYSNSKTMKNSVTYVQNASDDHHINAHLGPLLKQLRLPPGSGSTKDGRFELVLENFGDGHNMPYQTALNPFIDSVLHPRGGKP